MMGPSLSDPLVTPEHGLGDDLGVSDIAGGLARPKRGPSALTRAWVRVTLAVRFLPVAIIGRKIDVKTKGWHRRCACGCSSGVERNLAKVEVVGSNPITRSNSPRDYGSFP